RTRPAFISANPASIPSLAASGKSSQSTACWAGPLASLTSSVMACSIVVSSGKSLIAWTIFCFVIVVSIVSNLWQLKGQYSSVLTKLWDCFFKKRYGPGFRISDRLRVIIFPVFYPQFGFMDQLMKYLLIVRILRYMPEHFFYAGFAKLADVLEVGLQGLVLAHVDFRSLKIQFGLGRVGHFDIEQQAFDFTPLSGFNFVPGEAHIGMFFDIFLRLLQDPFSEVIKVLIFVLQIEFLAQFFHFNQPHTSIFKLVQEFIEALAVTRPAGEQLQRRHLGKLAFEVVYLILDF